MGCIEPPTTAILPVPVSLPKIGEGVVVPTFNDPGSNVKEVP